MICHSCLLHDSGFTFIGWIALGFISSFTRKYFQYLDCVLSSSVDHEVCRCYCWWVTAIIVIDTYSVSRAEYVFHYALNTFMLKVCWSIFLFVFLFSSWSCSQSWGWSVAKHPVHAIFLAGGKCTECKTVKVRKSFGWSELGFSKSDNFTRKEKESAWFFSLQFTELAKAHKTQCSWLLL